MYKGGQVGSTMYKGMPPPDPPSLADTKTGDGKKTKKKRLKRAWTKTTALFAGLIIMFILMSLNHLLKNRPKCLKKNFANGINPKDITFSLRISFS